MVKFRFSRMTTYIVQYQTRVDGWPRIDKIFVSKKAAQKRLERLIAAGKTTSEMGHVLKFKVQNTKVLGDTRKYRVVVGIGYDQDS